MFRKKLLAHVVLIFVFLFAGISALNAEQRKEDKDVEKLSNAKTKNQGKMLTSQETTKLVPFVNQPLSLGSIKPTGWLLKQLRTQANGLSGHLDEFWADVQSSKWIGGVADGTERLPYWLDGVIPLAYLLDDETLKQKVNKYIDYILVHQNENGWFGPYQNADVNDPMRDPWPIFVLFKGLQQYYDVSEDPRVIPAMLRFAKCLDARLDQVPLASWSSFRWQDYVYVLHWLYEQTGDSAVLGYAEKIHKPVEDTIYLGAYDWGKHFSDLPFKEAVAQGVWILDRHVVNNAMGIKAPAVWYRQSGDASDLAMSAKAIEELDKYHGQATGVFSGDECLAGKMPSQGTELCAVVEYMFSLETLASINGGIEYGDRLEKIAYNALPAFFKPDMWAHQYVQQANQVLCKVIKNNQNQINDYAWHIYNSITGEANIFGLEPNFGCCLANMHQGWPKFAANLWMKTADGGLAAIAYAPCIVNTKISDADVTVEVKTDYPFDDKLTFKITTSKAVAFPLKLRIPSWTKYALLSIDSEKPEIVMAGSFHIINRTWKDTTSLLLKLPMSVSIERRYNDAVSISRGPLVYCLKIGEYWKYLRGKHPYADWEVYPTTQWNYAIEIQENNPSASITFEQVGVGDKPFSPEGAPVIGKVYGRLLPEWTIERFAAAAPPRSPVFSDQPITELTLIPYGCAKLRITEFPVLK